MNKGKLLLLDSSAHIEFTTSLLAVLLSTRLLSGSISILTSWHPDEAVNATETNLLPPFSIL